MRLVHASVAVMLDIKTTRWNRAIHHFNLTSQDRAVFEDCHILAVAENI